jgi:hypothetical protein
VPKASRKDPDCRPSNHNGAYFVSRPTACVPSFLVIFDKRSQLI